MKTHQEKIDAIREKNLYWDLRKDFADWPFEIVDFIYSILKP